MLGELPSKIFRSREDELFFSAGFSAMCAQTQAVCWRRLAPHAGAGTYFRYEAKVSKDSPKGTFGIRLGNDPRQCKQKLSVRRSNENAHSPGFIKKQA